MANGEAKIAAVSRDVEQPGQEVEEFKLLSVRQLMWRKFIRNRMAVVSGVVLILFYLIILFADFFAPYDMNEPHSEYLYAPPHRLRIMDSEGRISPGVFVYRMVGKRDPKTFRFVYTDDRSIKDYIYFFVRGDTYKLFGLFESDLHFFGVKTGHIHLFGTDKRGRCRLSRAIFGGRVSLSIGLLGVFLTVSLGSIIGTVSGYYGGWADNAIQRVIELLRSFPQLPLWMALTAVLPPDWPSTSVYFGIVVVLAFIGWTSLAREVRGKVLSLRSTDFVAAAEASGAGTPRIIFIHMIPNMASHIMVTATLGIPIMILGESALSFLGLGIKPPLTSWGLLLQEAQKIQVLRLYSWMLIPAVLIIISVLCFNFVGDGLRDVVDPFSE